MSASVRVPMRVTVPVAGAVLEDAEDVIAGLRHGPS